MTTRTDSAKDPPGHHQTPPRITKPAKSTNPPPISPIPNFPTTATGLGSTRELRRRAPGDSSTSAGYPSSFPHTTTHTLPTIENVSRDILNKNFSPSQNSLRSFQTRSRTVRTVRRQPAPTAPTTRPDTTKHPYGSPNPPISPISPISPIPNFHRDRTRIHPGVEAPNAG